MWEQRLQGLRLRQRRLLPLRLQDLVRWMLPLAPLAARLQHQTEPAFVTRDQQLKLKAYQSRTWEEKDQNHSVQRHPWAKGKGEEDEEREERKSPKKGTGFRRLNTIRAHQKSGQETAGEVSNDDGGWENEDGAKIRTSRKRKQRGNEPVQQASSSSKAPASSKRGKAKPKGKAKQVTKPEKKNARKSKSPKSEENESSAKAEPKKRKSKGPANGEPKAKAKARGRNERMCLMTLCEVMWNMHGTTRNRSSR